MRKLLILSIFVASTSAIAQTTYKTVDKLPKGCELYSDTQKGKEICDRYNWIYYPPKKRASFKDALNSSIDSNVGTNMSEEREASRELPCADIIGEFNIGANDKRFHEGYYYILNVPGEQLMFASKPYVDPYLIKEKIASELDDFKSTIEYDTQLEGVKELKRFNDGRTLSNKGKTYNGKSTIVFDDFESDRIYIEKGSELDRVRYNFKSKAFRGFYEKIVKLDDEMKEASKESGLYLYRFTTTFYYAPRKSERYLGEKDNEEKNCYYILFEYSYRKKGGGSKDEVDEKFYLFEDGFNFDALFK
ncbi:MAG: hypothetical protein KI790_01335 [Cyclobacteriaceae bacterium]|nr:hypothetical protein [Cyclobacteriaceae bacterium HetDA_MAG_MS6]